MAGGGGGKTESTTSTSAPQTTTTTNNTTTATSAGNTGTVNQAMNQTIYPGTDAETAKVAIDANVASLANGINLISETQAGAADLISKALGLAAATSGQTSAVVTALTTPAPAQGLPATNSGAPIDVTAMTPWLVAGVVAFFVFKKVK